MLSHAQEICSIAAFNSKHCYQ